MNSTTTTLEYRAEPPTTEGVLTGLVPPLAALARSDQIRVDEPRGPGFRTILYLRAAGKLVFHIRVVRQSGRYLVDICGFDPRKVLEGVRVCRDHFDEWFGISGREIAAFESQRQIPKRAQRGKANG